MNIHYYRKNRSGFSLIEVVITLGIFSIGMLAVTNLSITQFESIAHASNMQEANIFIQEYSANLSKKCSSYLNTNNIVAGTNSSFAEQIPISLKRTDGSPLVGSYGRITIESIYLSQPHIISSDSTIDTITGKIYAHFSAGNGKRAPIDRLLGTFLFERNKISNVITTCTTDQNSSCPVVLPTTIGPNQTSTVPNNANFMIFNLSNSWSDSQGGGNDCSTSCGRNLRHTLPVGVAIKASDGTSVLLRPGSSISVQEPGSGATLAISVDGKQIYQNTTTCSCSSSGSPQHYSNTLADLPQTYTLPYCPYPPASVSNSVYFIE